MMLALLNNVLISLAQAAPTTAPVEPPGWAKFISGNGFFFVLLALMVLMIFMSRSKVKTEEKQRQEMLANLKKGDRVQTIGGVIANVVSVDDKEVVLKVDETTNTKMRFSRSAIHRVLDGAETK
jgi:preprotein translocase subunit YajC